jgi:uncharacterized protein GlcG (DUF336 family)
MSSKIAALAGAVIALVASSPVHATGVRTDKNLSLDLAATIAETALATCRGNGFHVSITVLDRAGEALVFFRDDGASPHTVENSRRKAYTARTFGIPSSEFAGHISEPPRQAQATLPGIIALAGGLPIKAGTEVIGSIGVSGSPGGEKDEACGQAGIDKVADQLK